MSQQSNSNTANDSPRTRSRSVEVSGSKRRHSNKLTQHTNASSSGTKHRKMTEGNTSTVVSARSNLENESYQSDSDIDDREQNSSEDVDVKKLLFALQKHINRLMSSVNRLTDDNKKIRDDFVKLTQEVKERPPVKNVEGKYNAGNCSSLSDCVISVGLQTSINSGLRMYIRNEVYGELKFIKDDTMANNMIKQAVVKNYIQMPNGWTSKLFRSHMTRRAYQAFGGIRQNNMSQARKKFIGKNW